MTAREFIEQNFPSTPGVAKFIMIERLEKFVDEQRNSPCRRDRKVQLPRSLADKKTIKKRGPSWKL